MNYMFAPYSPSKLETAYLCPDRFKNIYILKMKPIIYNQVALDKGNLVHYVLEKIFKKRVAKEPLSTTDVDSWIAEGKSLYPHINGDLMTDIQEMCYSMISRSLEIPGWSLAESIEIEKEIAIDFNGNKCSFEDPLCFARGKIDVFLKIGHEAVIIDHKTQKNYEKPDTTKMRFYAWLVCKAYPDIQKVTLILNFCDPVLNRYSHPVTLMRYEIITPSPGEYGYFPDPDNRIMTAEEIIMNQIHHIESYYGKKKWPQIVNSKCIYCPAYLSCETRVETTKELMKTGAFEVDSREKAEKALKMILIAEDYIEILKEQIKQFIDREDIPDRMVRCGDMAYMKKPETHMKLQKANKEELEKFIKDLGYNPDEFKEWSSTKIKKLAFILEDPAQEIKLKSIVPYQTVVKTGIYKSPF